MNITTSQRICLKCDGKGKWVNPYNDIDVRTCFACNGTGKKEEIAPVTAPAFGRRRMKFAKRHPVDDLLDVPDGVQLPPSEGDFGDLERAIADKVSDKVRLDMREEINLAVEREGRGLRQWSEAKWESHRAQLADEVVAKLERRVPKRIELTQGGITLPEVQGHKHPKFETLLRLATSRTAEGYVPCIWVTGPAGSGKTTGAKMLAQALGRPFFVNGALETKFEATGYKDAAGHYHPTEFRKAFGQASVYLFDDIDGCDSNGPVLALNSALANNLMAFPDETVQRHKDCIVIATANTWGLGATADYVGRIRFDGAFLDRFGGKLHWGYDEDFEREICGNAEWARRVQRARQRAAAAGLKVLITPRASIAGAAYLAAGFEEDEVAEMTFLAGLSKENRRAIGE